MVVPREHSEISPKGKIVVNILRANPLATSTEIVRLSEGQILPGTIWRTLKRLLKIKVIRRRKPPKGFHGSGRTRWQYTASEDGRLKQPSKPSEFALAMVGGLANISKRERKSIKDTVG